MVADTEDCKEPSSVSMMLIVSYFKIEMARFTFIDMFKCSVVLHVRTLKGRSPF